VRALEDAERLFAAGVARVVVGSAAVRTPEAFAGWLAAAGAERFCLALDLRRGDDGRWRPAVDAWQAEADTGIEALLDRLRAAGLRHVLTTDIAQDGMRAGPNLALYRELAARWPCFDWIASGGVRDRGDVADLARIGIAACVAGTALLEGSLSLEDLAACSRAA
jgi:phosphoribosylformimino-5-aminoimidazole carboxamide ribotide isomerase